MYVYEFAHTRKEDIPREIYMCVYVSIYEMLTSVPEACPPSASGSQSCDLPRKFLGSLQRAP